MLFDARVETEYNNGVDFDHWIGLWQKAFCERPKQAFKFLVYTGFQHGNMKEVISPVMIRTKDILGQGN